MPSNPTNCPVCNVPAKQKCSGCKNVVYCGKEHQKIHWRKGHKAECKCFEIGVNSLLGRHLVATRDIKQGEIILRENPLIYGPKVASSPICLGCNKKLEKAPNQKNFYKCRKCTWPLCGEFCENSKNHRDECEVMAKKKFTCKIDAVSEGNKKESAYCVVLPLRCILMKTRNPEGFRKLLELEDHLGERIKTPLYEILKANLLTFVKTILGFEQIEELDILRIAAILDTNSFEIRQQTVENFVKIRGIYPEAAMISHDCTPNARHYFDENMQLIFIAKVPISKGEIIATSYTQPLKSTLMRREHLKQAKCFDCCCKRCSDESEFNTFTGAILCSKCKVGKIIPLNPLDNSSSWQCQLCDNNVVAKRMLYGNASILKEIDGLNKSSPRAFEDFIIRYQDTLHPTNTHVLQVKYALTQLYGNVEGFMVHELNDAAVKRKLELCNELLEIADLFDPGWSLFRGNLLLDLQEIMVVHAKREYMNGLDTKENTQDKLMEAMKILQEAMQILIVEPEMKSLLEQRTKILAQEIEMD